MDGYTVNPKGLMLRNGSQEPDDPSYYYQTAQDEAGSYQIPSGGGNPGPFRPGGGDHLIGDDDGSGAAASAFAPMGIDSHSYIDNTYGSGEAYGAAVASPGNETAADSSDFDYLNNHSHSVTYVSRRGRPIATETEGLDPPRDGVPQLPGDACLHTTYTTATRDITLDLERLTNNYHRNFQPSRGGAALAGWAHWSGLDEDEGMTKWDYRTHDGGAKAVHYQLRRAGAWADEDLNRHTALPGRATRSQKHASDEKEKKDKEEKRKEDKDKEEKDKEEKDKEEKDKEEKDKARKEKDKKRREDKKKQGNPGKRIKNGHIL